MHDKILEVLKGKNTAVSVSEIEEALGFTTVEDLKILIKELAKLENEAKIYKTKKGNYMLFSASHLKLGKLIVNRKGFGFVDVEGTNDVFVSGDNMNGAIHGDLVAVEIISGTKDREEGSIVRIVERNLKQMVGEYYFKKGVGYVDLDDEKIKLIVEVDREHSLGAVAGHKVLVRITKKVKNNHYKGIVVKVLGHKNDPGVDILSIVHKYGINDTFSDEIMDEVNNIPDFVSEDEMKGRRDLRDQVIFTIDGDDTKDIDDAISITKKENGNYYLGVHIADVSYYVKENTALDNEAYDRGTSVYLADRVIPMLPHKLSNGICSLNPEVDRLAMSCEMEIDPSGKVVDYNIFPSVIKSRIQMTYKKVNKFLEENIVVEGYEPFVKELTLMEELAKILRKYKEKRGYIDFDIDESKIIVDENGTAIDVILRDRGTGEKLIEDFMIAANETVATAIFNMELPFVYRVHGKPSEEKITNFLNFVRVLGYDVSGLGKVKEFDPKTMQKILETLKDTNEFGILSKLLLRSMQKAVYDKKNIGHFGLASDCYTHFTSPIRRYPDTTVHRLLRKYLFEHQINNGTIDYWENKLVFLTEHSSKKERDSIDCEREVTDMKKAEYMMQHIGERFTGIISSVMSFGLFIELPNLIEGLVRVEDLKDDFYTFDEVSFSLIGAKNKRGYRLGDTVEVVVKNANKDAKTIDFMIYKEQDGNTEPKSDI